MITAFDSLLWLASNISGRVAWLIRVFLRKLFVILNIIFFYIRESLYFRYNYWAHVNIECFRSNDAIPIARIRHYSLL